MTARSVNGASASAAGIFWLALLLGCSDGGDAADLGVVDSAVVDSAVVDSTADTPAPDAAEPDAAAPDAAVPDATILDAALPDAGAPDAAAPDAVPDAAVPDAAVPDAAVPDAVQYPTPELMVNATTGSMAYPQLDMTGDGRFIVVYHAAQDGDGWAAVAQRFSSQWSKVGGELVANTFTTGDQKYPSVGMAADGSFWVAWVSEGQDGSDDGVFAQRFDATGAKVGAEVQVNTFTTGEQGYPQVGMSASGQAVIAWTSFGQDGDGAGVFAQRFDATGNMAGGELQINTTTSGDQQVRDVRLAADGSFVIVWGGAFATFLRRYSAAGAPLGSEVQVATGVDASLGMASDGRFVVAWQLTKAGTLTDIYAQRYDAAGTAQGSAFLVNTSTTGHQRNAAAAMSADGSFIIAWRDEGLSVYVQRYGPLGAAVGGETKVNLKAGSGDVMAGIDDMNHHAVGWWHAANVYVRGFDAF